MPIGQLLEYLTEPPMLEIARFWDGARAGRRFPAWRDIDAVVLAAHLPILWAWRWDAAQRTFVGRLAGEAILESMGTGFRGGRLQDYFAGRNAETFMHRYSRVIGDPAIMANRGFVFSLIGGTGIGERIALPLSEDGVTADGVFGATIYRVTGNRLARDRITVAAERESVEFFPV